MGSPSTSLHIRISLELKSALFAEARRLRVKPSELSRVILARGLAERTVTTETEDTENKELCYENEQKAKRPGGWPGHKGAKRD